MLTDASISLKKKHCCIVYCTFNLNKKLTFSQFHSWSVCWRVAMVSSLPDNRTDDDGVLSDLYSALFKSAVCKYVTD